MVLLEIEALFTSHRGDFSQVSNQYWWKWNSYWTDVDILVLIMPWLYNRTDWG